jgi:signal transduction histidine kinase
MALQKELEERNRALAEAVAGLQELARLKESFTAMLVHDLRSPLTGLMGLLDLLNETGEPQPRLMEQARRAVDSMVRMLNDLLEVFRSDSGAITLDPAPVAPLDLLREVCEAFDPEARAREISLASGGPRDLPEILVDPRLVHRILANLVGNALKYTSKGGHVRLEAAQVEGAGVDLGLRWVQITVTDDGRGIPADRLPYIFDPYRQASRRDAGQGFGLGLAIVQRLMADHSGRVHVSSQEGIGTTFSLFFPLSGRKEAP